MEEQKPLVNKDRRMSSDSALPADEQHQAVGSMPDQPAESDKGVTTDKETNDKATGKDNDADDPAEDRDPETGAEPGEGDPAGGEGDPPAGDDDPPA